MTVMDSQWLRQCREGDPLAIERLVQTHQTEVYRLALSILDDPDEAEDAVQEVFVSALRSLDSFRGDASLKTWLFRIAINLCRSRYRRDQSRGRPPLPVTVPIGGGDLFHSLSWQPMP
jgi:RNA polymerase sigma-70 factor (ECF subfamily)